MEVKCINCGLFFSIDDNLYKGEYENFCGVPCQTEWMEKSKDPQEKGQDFVWSIPKGD